MTGISKIKILFLLISCGFFLNAAADPINALSVGLKRNTGVDQTAKLQEILNLYKDVYIPEGTYILSSINVPSNRNIFTDGYLTRFQHQKRMADNKNMIRFEGVENISLQKFSVEGTFLSEPNRNTEYLNLVNVRAGSKNINFEGIKAKNAWGDGLLITGNPKIRSRNPTNINIKEIYTSNIYRNGVSVVGGINIVFGRVYAEKSGLVGFDAETEAAIIDGLYVKYFNGDGFRITGRNSGSVKNVKVDSLFIDGSKAQGISQKYISFQKDESKQLHGLILCGENIDISYASISNLPGAALMLIRKIPSKNITIKNLKVANCCIDYVKYKKGVPFYIINNTTTPLNIGILNASMLEGVKGVRVLRGKQGANVLKYAEKKVLNFNN